MPEMEEWLLNRVLGVKSKTTPKQWDEIRRRYNEGETASELAQEFGISVRALHVRVGRR